MSEKLVDPKEIGYPANVHEWNTYMRLKLAGGDAKLTGDDVRRERRGARGR